MYRDSYIIPCGKFFGYLQFKILDNSEAATYNEDMQSSENTTKRRWCQVSYEKPKAVKNGRIRTLKMADW